MYKERKRLFVRNFFLFCAVLLVCMGGFVYFLLHSNEIFERSRQDIQASSEILSQTEEISTNLEQMLVAHNDYELHKKNRHYYLFQQKAEAITADIAALSGLVKGNDIQEARVDALQRNFALLKTRLEAQIEDSIQNPPPSEEGGDSQKISDYVTSLKARILSIHSTILKEENQQLKDNIAQLAQQKDAYLTILIFGCFFGTILLILLDLFLLTAQSRRLTAEEQLKDNQERFRLAIEGMNDGIWDWNIETGQTFYSAQFFHMLGFEQSDTLADTETLNKLIHPDDLDRVWDYINRYIDGALPEFSVTFRMKNADGNWSWIQAKAKAIFNSEGEPLRMVGVHSDITYLKEYQEFLKREKQHAEQATVAKSEFLAHMSHEIRTPLTAINGIAEIFDKNKDKFDEKQKRLIQTLKNSTSSLKDLINDILDFSKIEEGEIHLEREYFPMDEFFEQIYHISEVQASEKGIGYHFDYKNVEDIEFYGDSTRLRQIAINLIGNAIKFTDQGRVDVNVAKVKDKNKHWLRIEVKDTGIGIPKHKLEVIFERFKQSDDSISRAYGGTGLGLSISKKLVDLMEGRIEVESREGEGSIFTVWVPMIKPKKNKTEKVEKADKIEVKTPVKPDNSDQKRVLIVEDYEGNIVVLSYLLDQMGLEFDIARNGIEALEKWQDQRYGVILMDIQMPKMDGFTATAKIREAEQESGVETPIIGMTAHALVGDREKCLNAGMNGYIPKPINENDLRQEILKQLAKNN